MGNISLILSLIKLVIIIVILLLFYLSIEQYKGKSNRIMFMLTLLVSSLLVFILILIHSLDVMSILNNVENKKIFAEIIGLKNQLSEIQIEQKFKTVETVAAAGGSITLPSVALPGTGAAASYYKVASIIFPYIGYTIPIWNLTTSALLLPGCGGIPYYIIRAYLTGTILESIGNTTTVAADIMQGKKENLRSDLFYLAGSVCLVFGPKLIEYVIAYVM